MKPITKIIIFLVIAFVLIIGITFFTKPAVAPAVVEETPKTTMSPAATVSPVAGDKAYTIAEVAKHKTATDCWTTVGGNVFDLTPFVKQHPGGIPNISKVCGIDGTALFTQVHGSNANAQKALASLKIGILVAAL